MGLNLHPDEDKYQFHIPAPYQWGKSSHCPLHGRPSGTQSCSGNVSGTEPQLSGYPTSGPVTTLTPLFQPSNYCFTLLGWGCKL